MDLCAVLGYVYGQCKLEEVIIGSRICAWAGGYSSPFANEKVESIGIK